MQHPSTEADLAVRDDQQRASRPVTSAAIVVRQRCSATIRYRSTLPGRIVRVGGMSNMPRKPGAPYGPPAVLAGDSAPIRNPGPLGPGGFKDNAPIPIND